MSPLSCVEQCLLVVTLRGEVVKIKNPAMKFRCISNAFVDPSENGEK